MPAHRKYNFTPEVHKKIKETYETATGRGEIERLAKQIRIPRCLVTRYARRNGLTKTVNIPWTEEEIKILKLNARYHYKIIQDELKKKGYTRSEIAIKFKLTNTRFLQNLKGQSATQLAECFGVGPKVVLTWIEKGYLKAERRGTGRDKNDNYYITNYYIKKFIQECVDIIDLRKVDKWWFIDLAFGGQHGLSPLSLDDTEGEGFEYK